MPQTQDSRPEIAPGEFARDTEQTDDPEEDDRVIVLNRTETPIEECVVYEEPDGTVHTVDQYNSGYAPEQEGVEAVYVETVDQRFDGCWRTADVLEAYESGVLDADRGDGGYGMDPYTFPAGRLEPVGGE